MTYANKIGVPYTMIIGDNEKESKVLGLKNMVSGNEEKLAIEKIVKILK